MSPTETTAPFSPSPMVPSPVACTDNPTSRLRVLAPAGIASNLLEFTDMDAEVGHGVVLDKAGLLAYLHQQH